MPRPSSRTVTLPSPFSVSSTWDAKPACTSSTQAGHHPEGDILPAFDKTAAVAKADVSRRSEMEEVLRLAEERFGGIHGVIHSAGVPGAGVIQLKTREEPTHIPKQDRRQFALGQYCPINISALPEDSLDLQLLYHPGRSESLGRLDRTGDVDLLRPLGE